MELKAKYFCTCLRAVFVSIEPLWNWKLNCTVLSPSAVAVSIEPLWNWKRKCERLKAVNLRFQSNLYGIESVDTLLRWVALLRFNRTFMELKDYKGVRSGRYLCTFQSNLYGIESGIADTGGWTNGVSIEPLWNWKRLRRISFYVFRPFQSNLYGIESLLMLIKLKMRGVSIEPLWNWKIAYLLHTEHT